MKVGATKLLLDTCTLIWLSWNSGKVSSRAASAFLDADEVYLSAASTWELVIKYATGKLGPIEHPSTIVPSMRESNGILELVVTEEAALSVVRLPDIHPDPFDRLLIGQAITHGLTILTPDEAIRQYPVNTYW